MQWGIGRNEGYRDFMLMMIQSVLMQDEKGSPRFGARCFTAFRDKAHDNACHMCQERTQVSSSVPSVASTTQTFLRHSFQCV